MGIVSDQPTSRLGKSTGRAHNTVAAGGMGAEMAGTRMPDLSIMDAIWINAAPGNGPSTSCEEAKLAKVVAASTDPVDLDAWAAGEILMPAASAAGYSDLSSIDPNTRKYKSFSSWLNLSCQELRLAGMSCTADPKYASVFLARL